MREDFKLNFMWKLECEISDHLPAVNTSGERLPDWLLHLALNGLKPVLRAHRKRRDAASTAHAAAPGRLPGNPAKPARVLLGHSGAYFTRLSGHGGRWSALPLCHSLPV